MSKVVQLKASPTETRAARVRALLKDREKADEEIAAILREQLDDLGEAKWLAWCEQEFGWRRSTAYKHLNPEQIEADRKRKARANVRNSGHESGDDGAGESIEDEIEDPANYHTSFMLRAEQAIRFAAYSGPVS